MNTKKALERAVIYIENHLDEDIRVEDVAHDAGYSYYHLTRQFTALLGESIGSYIKKRRLADAAKQLLYSNQRILDIALEHGFDSSEAFSRAFKAAYQTSPIFYRKNRLDLFISEKPKLDSERLNFLAEHITVHPNIIEIPDIKTAGLRGQTTLSDNVLPKLWKNFRSVCELVPDRLPNARSFGICEACGEGNTLYNMNREVLFSEITAVEVSGFEHLEAPFVSKVLKGGRYAVFTHTGSLTLLMQSYEYIWGTWFFSTNEQLDDREDFELYDERFLGYSHPNSQIDLYIPLCSHASSLN